MDFVDQIKNIEEKIDVLIKDRKKIDSDIKSQRKLLEDLQLEQNKDNYDNIEWLIKNPALPKVYETIGKILKTQYGYNIYNDGYCHNGDYTPIQLAFKFNEFKDNLDKVMIIKFFDDNLEFFEPVEEVENFKIVPFGIYSTTRCLHDLGYDPEHKVWIYYTTTYGRLEIQKEFDNTHDAVVNALEIIEMYDEG